MVADELANGSPAHRLVGFGTASGHIELSQDVDPPRADTTALLQRTGLTLDAGQVVFGFGGNYGDCSSYRGRVVAVPEKSGAPKYFTLDAAPDESQGAVWMGGTAPVVDGSGHIWVSTGAGSVYSDQHAYDDSDSILELSPSLQLVQFFAPGRPERVDQPRPVGGLCAALRRPRRTSGPRSGSTTRSAGRRSRSAGRAARRPGARFPGRARAGRVQGHHGAFGEVIGGGLRHQAPVRGQMVAGQAPVDDAVGVVHLAVPEQVDDGRVGHGAASLPTAQSVTDLLGRQTGGQDVSEPGPHGSCGCGRESPRPSDSSGKLREVSADSRPGSSAAARRWPTRPPGT